MLVYNANSWSSLPKQMILWALRLCINNKDCLGIYTAIHEWFGQDSHKLIQNAQVIAWANLHGAPIDMRFVPLSSESLRPEEEMLFTAIDAINEGDMQYADEMNHNIAGNFSDFSFEALKSMAEIYRRNKIDA